MRGTRTRWLAAGAGTLVGAILLGNVMAQEGPAPPGAPVATGLQAPRGLAPLADGAVLVTEGGGRLVSVAADGTVTVIAEGLPTAVVEIAPGEVEATGPSSAVPDGQGGYFLITGESEDPGMATLYRISAAGVATVLADLGDFEVANNPDGDVDLEGNPEHLSNPFDLVADGSGGVYVNDAGANATLHVAANGTIRVFAVYVNRDNPLFPEMGGPTMDQVPTGITIGPDGAVYVSTLTGFPFPAGEARVYRLEDQNGDGDALDEGEATIYATGLTTATDLLFDEDGSLLVTQFSLDMLAQAPGRVSRVVDGVPVTHMGGLISPTSITRTSDGRLLVSQEFAGMVSDITDSMPGAGFGSLASGLNLVQYSGGTLAQFQAEAASANATSVFATVGGRYITYVVGAPAFVNTTFTTQFADGLDAGTGLLIVAQ